VPKVLDFGIAKIAGAVALQQKVTLEGWIVGTPVYMAPERLRGDEADAGSDLWALGAVLFFAVEGYSAFERSSTAATMHAILNEVPFLSHSHGPLAAVITGLLNTHPEARPTAAQVRTLLAQAAGTPPEGVTMPVTGKYQPSRTPSPRWSKPLLVAMAVVAVGLLVGGYFLRAVTEPSTTPAERDPALTYGDGGNLVELEWDDGSPEGACLNNELGQGRHITQSSHVECTEPHSLEVFETRTFWAKPDNTYGDAGVDLDYPGVAGLTSYAESVCTMIFGSNKVPDTRDLRYRALVPSRKAWEKDGRRDIVCMLYNENSEQMSKSYVKGGEA